MKRAAFLTALIIVLLSFVSLSQAEETGRYGYIDRDGNVVIAPQFDHAYSFLSYGPGLVYTGKLLDNGLPDDGFYGYIDKTGKFVIEPEYSTSSLFSKDGLACVCKNGKYGVIDTDGNTVIDFIYDDVGYYSSAKIYEAFNGEIEYGSPAKGTYYIFDQDGKEIFKIKCERLFFYNDFFEARKDGKWALISLKGKKITGYSYEKLTSESSTSIAYQKKKDGKYGYMNLKGKSIIKPQFDSTTPFVDGKAIVAQDGKYFLIDEKGKVLLSYKADYIYMNPINGYTYAFEGTMSKYGSPEKGCYYLMKVDDGSYIASVNRNENTYLNPRLSTNGLWCVQDENGDFGALDMEGNIVFPFIHCDRLDFCGDDRFVISKGGMCALADLHGNLLTDYSWEDIDPSDGELLAVRKPNTDPDFRSIRWGMTEDEVISLEGTPDYTGKPEGQEARYIGYDTTLMGNKVILAYYFGPDGLYEARYVWAESHNNEIMYIEDYDNVRDQLTKKYGDPWYDEEIWDSTGNKEYYSDKKGKALSFGHLSYETDYRTSRTDIVMHMSADNYEVNFYIFYRSRVVSAPPVDYSDQF